ncbi:DUF3320 domain-containing protein [Chitinophagaceae bacterium MMS25-I14]
MSEPCKVEVEFVHLPVLNFAMQQNHVPVVRKFSIKNTGGNDLSNVVVTIHSAPAFALPWTQHIDILQKGISYEISNAQPETDAAHLASLTERIEGRLAVTIRAGEEVVYEQSYSIGVLAYDQWNGVSTLPEMLAAFVTPNHPEIPAVLRRAAVHLEKWTGNPSFDAYQTQNPDRVRKQMAAIYEAIAELQIIYCTVPASFEDDGQRVRLSDNIFTNKMGNCLDMSLLYAGCLEAVGLNPLIVVVKGHAFAGTWLIEDSFADAVNDDPSLLTKRTAAGISEITLIETTLMNAGSRASFDDAVIQADARMRNTDEFVLFVDIKRARAGKIRPLPLRVQGANGWEIIEDTVQERDSSAPVEIVAGARIKEADRTDISRQQLWERKLLDLTLRNTLLNIRITKSMLQFITVSPALLEDALAEGKEFQVLPKPADWENSLRSEGIYQAVHKSDPVAELVQQELTQKRLRAYLPENELINTLTNLYRSSRTALEENGANTLYIALGMLRWYETPASERPRYAPILLVPVEIVRKTAAKGFVIRSREEETMLNITLLEMLRQDFGIQINIDTLPKDDHGVDVLQTFSFIRQSIMAQSRWDVEEQVVLGTFSFSKFILWNDIHNNAGKLCESKIVASLVSGRQEWEPQQETEIINTDIQLNPADIALPVSTDSSQLEAIIQSSGNKSFVLHGPPGTGKSQTITNIIANALYNGKRVLFVAAKKAALEVVQHRLHAVGLGAFCLELHSNKSKKSAVLEQLKQTTEVVRRKAPENFRDEADRLYVSRRELNDYVQALHKKYPFGYSLYELFNAYVKLNQQPASLQFNSTAIANLRETDITKWTDLAEELQLTGEHCGSLHQHPLEGIQPSQYSQQLKSEAAQQLRDYADLTGKLTATADKVARLLQLNANNLNYAKLDALKNMAEIMQHLQNIPASLFEADAPEQTMLQLIELAEHGTKRDGIQSEILKNFQRPVLDINAAQTLTEWNAAAQKWFLLKWWQQRKITKQLKQYATGGNVEKDSVPVTLQQIISFKDEQSFINRSGNLTALLGFLYHQEKCDWQKLGITCHALLRLNREAIKITGIEGLKSWRISLGHMFAEGSSTYLSANNNIFSELVSLCNETVRHEAALRSSLGIDFNAFRSDDSVIINAVHEKTTGWTANIDQLKDWYNWRQAREKANAAGLSPLIAACENGAVEITNLTNSFKEALYRSCTEYIIALNPHLAAFNGKIFEEKIRKFAAISAQFEQLTQQELYARLASRLPAFTQEAAQSSEMGILQKAIRNNGRAMSIRRLFDSIPNLLPRLNPCMLMSPISVAQYFDAGNTKFDLVVFDEASQMPTCEAVGAIARGNTVIVVGDPKQLPPTNFFSTNNFDEDNADKEDLESILDDCLALSMPSKHLLWHYRSKHESLIAFSNARYYENKLLTFPSIDDITSKVQYVQVPGFYDKGKTRQNRAEAQAIVNEIVRRLSDPVLSKRSIGIVTFSSVQQNLIEDMLTEVFKQNPALEKTADNAEEPIFIKNLENVQGDERDVILFSICYGPDETGKVSLNFGPINRDGGWRRLNVAVSRARYEMVVYSTLRADQIDLSRTGSEGVAGLKAFLAYAEKGKTALPLSTSAQTITSDDFTETIAAGIRERGYEVNTNIGCSDYRIDIGIVDPAHPSRYLLGILTDGKNYAAAKTGRDREIVQTNVLKALGWRLHKIWSMDWWEHKEKVMAGIIAAIEEARNLAQSSNEEHTGNDKSLLSAENNASENTTSLNNNSTVITNNTTVANTAFYEIYNPPPLRNVTSDSFLQVGNRGKVTAQIMAVLQTESPVSKTLLFKRVLAAWGITRTGKSINAHFETLLTELGVKQVTHEQNIFLWKKEHDPHSYDRYRIPQTEEHRRDADDLPPEEIANCVKAVLKHQISLPEADLVKEVSRLLGFTRIGDKVENAIKAGIRTAVAKGFGAYENEKIVLKDMH